MSFELATAETEYAKDPRINRDHIQSLKQWAKDHPQLPDITEFMLIQCYEVSDYDCDRCKKLVEIYYDYKVKCPELFTGRDYDPSKYQISFHDIHSFFAIPNVTCRGYRILYYNLKNNDTQYFDSMVLFPMALKSLFSFMMEGGSCPGYLVVVDISAFKFGHIRKINFMEFKKLVRFVTEGIPIKVKEIHIIRANRITYYLRELIRPFLTKEINDMIHVHADMNKLLEKVPKDCLTKDLDGSLPLTRDEYNEIQRKKVTCFWKDIDRELLKRSNRT